MLKERQKMGEGNIMVLSSSSLKMKLLGCYYIYSCIRQQPLYITPQQVGMVTILNLKNEVVAKLLPPNKLPNKFEVVGIALKSTQQVPLE